MEVVQLPPGDLRRVVEIDRSERVTDAFDVVDGELRVIPVDWDVPTWDPDGSGEHSLRSLLDEWQPVVDGDGVLLGVEGRDGLAGIAIVVPDLEPELAWMAFLYVTRPERRGGVATALWNECERRARVAGATAMCVSAVPSGPAIRFYVGRGCVLAPDPHPRLVAMEPDDIQLVKRL